MIYNKRYDKVNSSSVKLDIDSKYVNTLSDFVNNEIPIVAFGSTLTESLSYVRSNFNKFPRRTKFLLPLLSSINNNVNYNYSAEIEHGASLSKYVGGGYLESVSEYLRYVIYSNTSPSTTNPYTGLKFTNNDIILANDIATSNTVGWIMVGNSWVDLFSVSTAGLIVRVDKLETTIPPTEDQIGRLFYSNTGLYTGTSRVGDPAAYLAMRDSSSTPTYWKKMTISDSDIELYESAIRSLFDDKILESENIVEQHKVDLTELYDSHRSDLTTQFNNYKTSTTNSLDQKFNTKSTEIDNKLNDLNALEIDIKNKEAIRSSNNDIVEGWIANPNQFTGPRGYSPFELWKQETGNPTATFEQYIESIRGPVGTGLSVKNALTSTDDLPSNPSVGDAYLIGDLIYVWNGSSWVSNQFVGPAGKDAAATPVIDTLTSSSTTSALSANQGRILDRKITDVSDNISTITNSEIDAMFN